jgi:vancomycin resistance protein YoaR
MKNKFFQLSYVFLAFLLISVSLIFIYYIVVNTVLSHKVLAVVKINNYELSIKEGDDISEIQSQLQAKLPETIKYSIDGQYFEIPSNQLQIEYDFDEVMNYGKGASFEKVFSEGLTLLEGKTLEVPIKINVGPIINLYLANFTQENTFINVNNNSISCAKTSLFYYFDEAKLEGIFSSSLQSEKTIEIQLSNVLKNQSVALYFSACSQYNREYDVIKNAFASKNILLSPEIFSFSFNSQGSWQVSNRSLLVTNLKNIKDKTDVKPQDGEYEISNDQVWLFKNYQVGKSLNINATIDALGEWTKDLEEDIPLVYDDVAPDVLSLGLEILDFTKEIGVGKTRIDLVRNGVPNIYVAYAKAGVDEMHNRIVGSGEEFSFIQAINPNRDLWTTKNGRVIGSGYCNSTTTLFRAALESGFQITDRSYHYHYVASYEWGYPINIVDAAFLLNPDIDTKFVNDLAYPVILRAEATTPGDGWEYHTIRILGSSKTPDRKVELSNFHQWNMQTSVIFEGSFDRSVYDDGVLVRQDSFYSKYL